MVEVNPLRTCATTLSSSILNSSSVLENKAFTLIEHLDSDRRIAKKLCVGPVILAILYKLLSLIYIILLACINLV
ncbi:hypothetical protein VIBNISFn118_630012 [Vibrio nigripulchritudo SFn118]|nr:hypothetical protein VIBNISFn118_630012 [Vibrio nigripulchritudo SFn118]